MAANYACPHAQWTALTCSPIHVPEMTSTQWPTNPASATNTYNTKNKHSNVATHNPTNKLNSTKTLSKQPLKHVNPSSNKPYSAHNKSNKHMNANKRADIFKRLQQANPNPTTELVYHSTFELLIAVMLSAQATDISVNKATKPLFNIANTPQAIINLGLNKLKQHIKTTI